MNVYPIKNNKCIVHFYNQIRARGFYRNVNGTLLEVPTKRIHHFKHWIQLIKPVDYYFFEHTFIDLIIYIDIYNMYIPGAVGEKCPIFFGFCRKLTSTKTEQITKKESKHNVHTLFLRILTGGDINFIFYVLSYLNFTSPLFVLT